MSIQEKVRYEEMLPHEIVGARNEFPLAWECMETARGRRHQKNLARRPLIC